MPKAKLKIAKSDIEKLKVGAYLTDTKIEKGTAFGETAIVEVSVRDNSQLFELGKQVATLPADSKLPEAPAEVATPAPAKGKK
jgi:hypothetical protein